MRDALCMAKDEMRQGLGAGRRLTQEEWAHPDEIRFVDELIAEGVAQATQWEYGENFQCSRRYVSAAAPSAGPPIPPTLVAAAKALVAAVEFDDSGVHGRGGNGGLISRDTIRKADELRLAIAIYEALS